MKRLFYIPFAGLLIGLFTGLLSGCDSWLDVVPENSVTYANFFENETELEAIVTEYNAHIVAFLMDPADLQINLGILADEWPGYETLRQWLPTRVNMGGNMSPWKHHYDIIFMANVLLDNSSKASANISRERLDFWNGQAYFAKGLTYYMLARQFGEAVITDNSTSLRPYAKSSILEVIDESIRNTEEALRLLPKYENMTGASGRAITTKQYGNQGSAAALLSHLYAWRGSMIDLYGLAGDARACYTRAVAYADTLIDGKVGNYSLQPTPEDLCVAHSRIGSSNPESIFEVELDPNSLDHVTCRVPGRIFQGWPVNIYDTPENLANRPLRLFQSTVNRLYESTDLRKSAYFQNTRREENGQVYDPATAKYACQIKWREGLFKQDASSTSTMYMATIRANFVMFRLADIYLLRAECRNKLGDVAGAAADLNKIRERAGATPFNGVSKELKLAIFQEREKELLGEGHRFYDVVRNGMDYIRQYLGETFKTISDGNIQKGALYLPVPPEAFDMNALMRQNEYWRQFSVN